MSTRRLATAREELEAARVAFAQERRVAMDAANLTGVVAIDEESPLYAATQWVLRSLNELGLAAVDAGEVEEAKWAGTALSQMREVGVVLDWVGTGGEGDLGGC